MRLKVLIGDFSLKAKPFFKTIFIFTVLAPSVFVTLVRIGITHNINNLPSSLEIKEDDFIAFVPAVDYFGNATNVNTAFFKDIEDISEDNEYKAKATLENGDILYLSFKDSVLKEGFFNQIQNKERFR